MKSRPQPVTPTSIFYPRAVAAAVLPMLVLDQMRLYSSFNPNLDPNISAVLGTVGGVGVVLIMLAVCERIIRQSGDRWLAAAALNFGLVEGLRALGVAVSLFTAWRGAATGGQFTIIIVLQMITGIGLALLAAFLMKRFLMAGPAPQPKGKGKSKGKAGK
jgi:hypothetical protein